MEGDTVTLNCTATGAPRPLITWTAPDQSKHLNISDDKRFVQKGSLLTLKSALLDDDGMWGCNAYNYKGEGVVGASTCQHN